MKNVVLIKGKCAICGGSIDKEWAGENPTIGTTCRNCFGHEDKLFGPENVDIVVQKHVIFIPLFDKYEYHFDWRGTRVMINGKVGTIQETYLGSCTVKFPDGKEWGDSISNLDYWRLKDIYEKTGGEMSPPPLEFKPHIPTKIPLLEHPILPVEVEMNDEGNISSIQVGHHSVIGGLAGGAPEIPILPILHAFCNLFVRYKFALSPNFACEGGFYGRDFEVRNAGGFIGGCGLSVFMHRREEQHPGDIKCATAQEVLSAWVDIMETLLRYDWTDCDLNTIDDVWKSYCTMQDILANVLAPDDLSRALDYAKKGEMVHAGSAY